MATTSTQAPTATGVLDDKIDALHSEGDAAASTHDDWEPKEERALLRRLDMRIIPYLCIVYGLSLLDRSNISAAYIADMDVDLELDVGSRYNLTLLVFFIPYTLLELPSNLIIRRLGARPWLTTLIVCWGVVVFAMGFVQSWIPLLVLRMLLGAFEAGVLPGAIFVISAWYKTYETAKRVSIFYMFALLANGFNGIISYGLSMIRAGNGMFTQGWRWIFIIEGAATIVAGALGPFFLGEFPEKSRWLTPRERHIAKERMSAQQGGKSYEHMTLAQSAKALYDWKVLAFCLQLYVAAGSVYALSYFMPIILRNDMGFSYTEAQLMRSPPYTVTVFLSVGSAWLSDRLKIRWPFLCAHALICTTGLLIMLYAQVPGARYFGTFLAVFGTQANTPGTLTYGSNQTGDPRKKGLVAGAMITFAALGGITGSTIFRNQDAPRYIPGMWTTISLQIAYAIGTFFLSRHLAKQNKRAENGEIPDTLEGVSGFRYAP